jgi:hypothetical protein
MGRPNKYPDQFRRDALELVKDRRSVRSPRWPDRSGSPRAPCGTGSKRSVMPTPARRSGCVVGVRTRRAAPAPQGEHRAADRQGDLAEGGGVFRPRDDEVIRFRFVQDNQADLPVKRMCELVEVPRSSFYAWVNHTPSARDLADVELLETIRDIYRRSRNTYGVPRVYGQLRRTGHRVARLACGPVDAREQPGRSARSQEVAAWPTRRRRPARPVEPELHRHGTEPAMGRRRHRVPDR